MNSRLGSNQIRGLAVIGTINFLAAIWVMSPSFVALGAMGFLVFWMSVLRSQEMPSPILQNLFLTLVIAHAVVHGLTTTEAYAGLSGTLLGVCIWRPLSRWQGLLYLCLALASLVLASLRLKSLFWGFLIFFDFVLVIAVLQQLYSAVDLGTSIRILLRQSLRFEAVLIVLFVALIFLVPQIYRLYRLPRGQNIGVTGFSGELNPGSVSRLVQSNRVAFRAKILGEGPLRPDQLYWRRSTLDEGLGLRWRRVRDDTAIEPPRLAEGPLILQQITILGRHRGSLIGLDRPRRIKFQDPKKKRVTTRRCCLQAGWGIDSFLRLCGGIFPDRRARRIWVESGFGKLSGGRPVHTNISAALGRKLSGA